MTNEEAIEFLYDIQTDVVYNITNKEKEALEKAMLALEKRPLCPLKEEKVYTQCEVAELLAETVGDDCACNVCGNDEWLPFVCECTDKCPSPGGFECWIQYLKHLEERFDVIEKEWGKNK